MRGWIVMVGLGSAACDAGDNKAPGAATAPRVEPGDAKPADAAPDAFDEDDREHATLKCPARNASEELAVAADVPAVAGAVLRYYATHPKELAGWTGRLPKRGDVFVIDEVTVDGTVQHLDTKSLQEFAPKRFVIKTMAEIQAASDKRDEMVGYLYFRSIDFKSTCAQVDFGLTVTIPNRTPDGPGMECCSSVVDLFHKGKPWASVGRISTLMY